MRGKSNYPIAVYKLVDSEKIPNLTSKDNHLEYAYTPKSIHCSCGNAKVKNTYYDNWKYKVLSRIKDMQMFDKRDDDPRVKNLPDDKIIDFFFNSSFNVYECEKCNNLLIFGLDENRQKFNSIYQLVEGKISGFSC